MNTTSSMESTALPALAPGFLGAVTACGLKPSGALDLALIWSRWPCTAAGVFTTNRVEAAPVVLDRERLATSASRIRGVILNSGCANAVTGSRGFEDALRMAELAAATIDAAPEQMLVMSTGVIGVHLDMDKVAAGIAVLAGEEARRDPGAVAR